MKVIHGGCLKKKGVVLSILCFIPVKTHHDRGNFYKRKHLTGACLQFRGVVHGHHGRENGGTQASMVLEKYLRVLHLDPWASERERHWVWFGL